MIPYAGVDLCVYTTLRDSLGPAQGPLLFTPGPPPSRWPPGVGPDSVLRLWSK